MKWGDWVYKFANSGFYDHPPSQYYKNLEKLSFQLSFESALSVVISVDLQNPIT